MTRKRTKRSSSSAAPERLLRPLPGFRARQLLILIALLLVASSCARKPRSLVVLAHPDDELTLVDYLRTEGSAAELMYLTRGEYPGYPHGRASEAEAARRFYGSASVQLLPAPMLPLAVDPSFAWGHWDVKKKIAAVVTAIDRYRPEEVVTWMPNIAAVHGEHQLTGAITVAACMLAKHPPRRLLFTYEARKVGYYRMVPDVLDPEKLGMTVKRYVSHYSLKKLIPLYPSMPVSAWLSKESDVYRQGTRLVVFKTPQRRVPLSPPSTKATLPPGNYRVISNFGGWLRQVGLAPLGRIIALAPRRGKVEVVGPQARFHFARHELRSTSRDGVLYVLLPRDVPEWKLFGSKVR